METQETTLKEKIHSAKNFNMAKWLLEVQTQSEKRLTATPALNESNVSMSTDAQSTVEQTQSISFGITDLLDVYIDAKDTVNNWCMAKITDQDLVNNKISIHFDGWSQKYDEIVRINSTRIAPFRKYTKGYTGQKVKALREFDLNYAYQVTLENKINQITMSEFTCFQDANECTQFIRGELWTYFDSLMTLPVNSSSQDVQKIFEFVTSVMRMILKWITIFPKFESNFKASQTNANLITVDIHTAVACCSFELLEMLQKCFNLCDRCRELFKQFRKEINYQSEFTVPEMMTSNGFMLSLINQFGDLNGFEHLLKLIKTEKDYKCPIPVMLMVIKTFLRLPELSMKKEFVINVLKQTVESIEERLKSENLKDGELKEVSLEEIKNLIKHVSFYQNQIDKEVDKHKVQEIYELSIAKRYLTCPFFEMRIKGMKEFGQIRDKIVNTIRYNQNAATKKQGMEFARYLDLKSFSAWILENEVCQFIFKENPHSELIKRSQSILYLLAQDLDTFPEDLVRLIWSCCSGEKHEDIVRATFELITELAKCLPIERMEFLFTLIKTIPISDIDDKTVTFLRDFTKNTISNLTATKARRQADQKKGGISQMFGKGKKQIISSGDGQKQGELVPTDPDDKVFDCQIFWDIAQDSNVSASARTKEQALQSLIEVLKAAQSYKPAIKDQFIDQALENIRQGKSVYSTIQFLQNLLGTLPHETGMSIGSSRQGSRQGGRSQQQSDTTIENVLSSILKKVDLHQLVIAQAGVYMKNRSVAESTTTGSKAQTHEECIRIFINFMEFVIVNSRSITFQFAHVQELFKIFVTEAQTEVETKEFFDFLTKENQNARSRERAYLLDERLRFQVFAKIMCNEKAMNCQNLNLQAYECFRSLFVGVNAQEGVLTVDESGQNITKVSDFGRIQGINTLWKICISCQNEEVRQLCRKSLCDLYLLLKPKSVKEKMKNNDLFVKQCRSYMENAQDQRMKGVNTQGNDEIILNSLRLMKTFISRFNKEHLIGDLQKFLSNLSQNELKNSRLVGVRLEPDGRKQDVEVNLNCQFWELMRKSAAVFNLKMSEFYIVTKKGPLPDDMYDYFMKQYDVKDIIFERMPEDRMEKEFPSYFIGYSKDCMDIFLEVLKNHNDSITNEVITLNDQLQIDPRMKGSLSDKINKLKVTNNYVDDEAVQKEWSQILSWGNGSELNQTYYKLTALKELTAGKQGQIQSSNSLPDDLKSKLLQEKQARMNLQMALIDKGGFNFLLTMFSKINKAVDFEKDTLTSTTLQLMINILDRLHSQKFLPTLERFESSARLQTIVDGCLIIIHQFLKCTVEKQSKLQSELVQKKEQDTDFIYTRLQNQTFDLRILESTLNFLNKILHVIPNSFQKVGSHKLFFQIIELGLLETSQAEVQQKILIFCQTLTQKIEKHQYESKSFDPSTLPSYLILKESIQRFVPMTLKEIHTQKIKTFFNLINQILSETQVYLHIQHFVNVSDLSSQLISMVYDRKIREATARDEDIVLSGLFEFIGILLQKFPEVRAELPGKTAFIQFLTHQGLFEKDKRMLTQTPISERHQLLPPMCKHPQTRRACLDLLRILCLDKLQDKLKIIDYLKQNVSNETFWRTPRKVDWSIHVQQQERALTGFVGLKNMGCICYMNSILQQLFMIPAFRKAIIEVEDRQHDQPNEENALFQVKSIFAGLMEVEKQYFNPKKFCRAFKDIDGSPIDPFVQKDVDEFFNLFMDRIEQYIKGTKEEKIMNNLFQGVFANEFICKDCPHYSEREEPFLAISLQVKNKHSVQESLKYYVEGEMLEGDNAYYCEKCEKKVNTLKRCCIKRMPNTLFLVLKRFEFDFDTMQKVKVNDYCEFPFELDMSPYSQQELARQDLIKQMDEKNQTEEDLNEEQLHILKRSVPENYYKYKLKGIVVHFGTADQGHYYSFIQDRESKNEGWFEFNDTLVRQFDTSEIPEEAFGGEDDNVANNISQMQSQNNGQVDTEMVQAMRQFKTKIKNAYVLIYDRVEMFDMQKTNDLIDDTKSVTVSTKELTKQYSMCKQAMAATVPQIPRDIQDIIVAKNQKFWLQKTIFSVNFIQQMYGIFKDFEFKPELLYNSYLTSSERSDTYKAFKFLISFFLTIAIRSKDRSILPDYMALIRQALNNNIGLCIWLIETFSSQDFIKEFFIDCPVHDMARFTQGLLKTAMIQVFKFEKHFIGEYCKAMKSQGGVFELIKKTQNIEDEQTIDGTTYDDSELTVCTGCSSTKLYKLKDNAVELPKLVIMMNSFIHMSTSFYCLKNFRMTGQFWAVFANFSMLGEEARLYLLQTQTLGRLTDILLNIQQDSFFTKQQIFEYSQGFRDESLKNNVPLFVYNKESYIGIDPERSQVQLSNSEKKEMYRLISQPKNFLILTISNLTRSCTLVSQREAQSFFALDNLNFVPGKEEMELLLSHKNIKWWANDLSKLARNAIAIMFAHISFENREFSQEYITYIIEMISQEHTMFIRCFERPLLRIAQLNDKFQQERIKRILQKLTELFKMSTGVYLAIDSIIEIVFKLSFRCPQFATQCINQHQDLLKLIDRFCKESPTMPVGQSKMKIFKEGQGIRWNDIKSSFLNKQKLEQIQQYSKDRFNRLIGHLKKPQEEQVRIAKLAGAYDFNKATQHPNKSQRQEELFDSDNDMFDISLQPGQQVDFMHNGNWYKGQVVIALDEMVKCIAHVNVTQQNSNGVQTQATQKIVHWIELESDNLAPANSITQNEKESLHKFYRDLSEFIN